MPTLDGLNRDAAFQTAASVPTRVLRPHAAGSRFGDVDEAHTTKTERSFEALKRLNPALILELTATPLPRRSNVLFHVSAQQLQAEHMIKMPITLVEHTRGWQAAVLDAVQIQRLLEAEARLEEAATFNHRRQAACHPAGAAAHFSGVSPWSMPSACQAPPLSRWRSPPLPSLRMT
jgi:hypothetical protein